MELTVAHYRWQTSGETVAQKSNTTEGTVAHYRWGKHQEKLYHKKESYTTGGTVAHYRWGETSPETLDYRSQLPRLENYTVVCSANK